MGINGYDTTLDVSDSSESDSEENLVLSNGERNKSPTNSQRTSSSCEESFVVSPTPSFSNPVAGAEASAMSGLSSPIHNPTLVSEDNPVFNTQSRVSAGGARGAATGKQVFTNGSNLYKAAASPSVQVRTPSSALKAAILEEEELMLRDSEKKSSDKVLLDLPGSDAKAPALYQRGLGGAGRRLFEGEEDKEEEESVLARPKEASKKANEKKNGGLVSVGSGMGLVWGNGEGDVLSLLGENKLECLLKPCMRKEILKCRMIRKRGIVGSYPVFEMLLDIPGIPEDKAFLLCARKRKKSKSSYYVISMKRDSLTRDSEGYIAKLRGNILGSEYTLFRKTADSDKEVSGDELMCVKYRQTLLSKDGGPRAMTAIFTDPMHWSHVNANRDLLRHYKETKEAARAKNGYLRPDQHRDEEGAPKKLSPDQGGQAFPPLIILKNLEPQWREDLQSYVLDFKGRVTEASVKNFVMVEATNLAPLGKISGEVVKVDSMFSKEQSLGGGRVPGPKRKETVIFGKRGKNEFSLDVGYPCSILQAFAMAIASTDFKMVNSL